MRSLVSLPLRGVSCMSRSPAGTGDCTTGTLESVPDDGTRRARQRGHVDATPIPNLQFVHRESSGRRSEERAHFTGTPTGFLLLCSNGLEQRNAKRRSSMSLKFAAKVHIYDRLGLHEAPSRPSVRGFLLNATNLAHHYGVVAKSFDAPGLAPGQIALPFACATLNARHPPTKTAKATIEMIIVASALTSGLTPRRTFEKITIGRVVEPGPETKLEMTRSSTDRVKARSQPDRSAGDITGRVTSVKTRKGVAPRSCAASSNDSSILTSRD